MTAPGSAALLRIMERARRPAVRRRGTSSVWTEELVVEAAEPSPDVLVDAGERRPAGAARPQAPASPPVLGATLRAEPGERESRERRVPHAQPEPVVPPAPPRPVAEPRSEVQPREPARLMPSVPLPPTAAPAVPPRRAGDVPRVPSVRRPPPGQAAAATPPAGAATSPASPTPAAATAEEPSVVIDSIHIITPPAAPPEPDPLASLERRRSRHVRSLG